MKVFRVYYDVLEVSFCVDYVVCEKKEEIIKILAERHNTLVKNIQSLRSEEVSKESVRIQSLTLGDLARFIK